MTRASDEVRVAEIMLEIERARARIVETIDALGNKADLPARLGDVISATAAGLTARVLERIPSVSDATPVVDEMDVSVIDGAGPVHVEAEGQGMPSTKGAPGCE